MINHFTPKAVELFTECDMTNDQYFIYKLYPYNQNTCEIDELSLPKDVFSDAITTALQGHKDRYHPMPCWVKT